MSKEKIPFVPAPKDVAAQGLTNDFSSKAETSDNKKPGKTTGSGERNAKSKNNANISRTNLDTELIDINSDGDSDESKYDDLMWKL